MASRDNRRLQRCREHGLSYDAQVAAGCVLCRRSLRPESVPGKRRERPIAIALAVLCSVAVISVAGVLTLNSWRVTRLGAEGPASDVVEAVGVVPANAAPTSTSESPTIEAPLAARNGSGRPGYLFVPPRDPRETLHLLVGLHGQGSDGREVIGAFRALAVEHRFAIVAPSSGFVAEMQSFTWRVGDKPDDLTNDFHHVKSCLDEVLSRSDVALDPSHALIVGFSGGASSAPYIATNTGPYAAFAVLHGGVFAGGIGPRKVPGWFSTGDADPARTPAHVFGQYSKMRDAGFNVTFKTYAGGHVVSSHEAADVVAWWLGLPP